MTLDDCATKRPPRSRCFELSAIARKMPRRLMAIMLSKSSGDMLAIGAVHMTPPFAATTSTRPNSRLAVAKSSWTSSALPASARTAIAVPPAVRIASTVSRAAASRPA